MRRRESCGSCSSRRRTDSNRSTEISAADALDIAVRLVSVGLAISGFELLRDRAAFEHGGPFDPRVYEALRSRTVPAVLAPPSAVATLAVVQIVASSVVVVVGPLSLIGRWTLVVALVASLVVRQRRVVGGDGAEQLSEIVLLSTALAVLPSPGDTRLDLAVVFIAAQLTLSYVTAGIFKLVSPVWRSGEALPGILSTYGHGVPWASRVVRRRPWLGSSAGWLVMLFEVTFPIVFVAPEPVVVAFLAIGLAFHLGCAVLMGLNSFLWAFPAAYPCVFATREILGWA
jgi:hypothetical protein